MLYKTEWKWRETKTLTTDDWIPQQDHTVTEGGETPV